MSSFDSFARQLLDDLCERFPMGYVPRLEWKALRVTAGVAYYRTGSITLSSRILNSEAAVRETLTHEYAHLLALHRHGRKGMGHGPGWRRAMLDLGLEPKVRHTYSVERNKPRQQLTYRCARCGTTFARSRRFSQRHRYVHVNCGGDLRLVGVHAVTANESVS